MFNIMALSLIKWVSFFCPVIPAHAGIQITLTFSLPVWVTVNHDINQPH